MCKPLEVITAIYLSAQITTPEQVIARIDYVPVKITDPDYDDNLSYSAMQKRFTKLFNSYLLGKGHPTSPFITQPERDDNEVTKFNPTFRAKLFLRAITPAGNLPMDQNEKILVNFFLFFQSPLVYLCFSRLS